jgi:two-component system, LytTR family, response regulator
MTPATALIVDDEPLARRKLRELVAETPWLRCLGEVGDGAAALEAIRSLAPDLVFLDVQMPGATGLDVVRRLAQPPAVIFTTAYDRYAVQAFELAAVDYLLKPFSRDRFRAALARARPLVEPDAGALPRLAEAMSTTRTTRMFVRHGSDVVTVRVAAVQYLEACDDFVWVHVDGRRYRLNLPLADVELRLDPAQFLRVHRSFLVNLDQVVRFAPVDGSRFDAHLRDGTVVPVSRQRSRAIRDRL